MHLIICGIGGYTLLLFSLIMFVILFRRGFKRLITSSFHTLFTSDVLSTLLTSVILILNHFNTFTSTNNKHDKNVTVNNYIWDAEYRHRNKLIPWISYQSNNIRINKTDINIVPNCNVTNTLMHYAMFLAPLTSEFVSLLIFSVHCNLNATCINKKYNELLLSQKSVENQRQNNDLSSTSENFVCKEKVTHNILNFLCKSKLCNMKNNQITSLCVIGQWLAMIFVTGALYFAELNNVDSVIRANDLDCIFTTTFPPENCHLVTNIMEYPLNNNNDIEDPEKVTVQSSNNNYTINEDLLKVYNPNDTEIENIISEVHKIVQLVLNNTDNEFNNIKSSALYNKSDLLENEVKYMTINNTKSNLTNNGVNENTNIFSDETLTKWKINISNFSNVFNQDKFNKSDNEINELDPNIELSLFNDLIEISTENLQKMVLSNERNFSSETNSTYYADSTTHTVEAAENMKHNLITEVTTDLPTDTLSDGQIFAEIIKRIQGSHAQIKKPRYNFFPEKDTEEHAFSITRILKNDTKYINGYNEEAMECPPTGIIDKCFISAKFLKLHLLMLVFLVYFLPILFSSILQERGKLVCENILDKLEAKGLNTPNLFSVVNETDKSIKVNNWLCENENQKANKLTTCPNTSTESQSIKSCNNEANTTAINRTRNQEIQDIEWMCLYIIDSTKCTQKTFVIVKRSLLLGIIFWSPIFIEVLFKIFLCMHISEWITNISFLAAVSYGIIKNIFNYKMLQLQENGIGTSKKENLIHPL